MKYTAPPSSLFIKNREKFIQKMKPNHIALFFSNERVTNNADSHYPFEQNSSTYYLSGIDQEETILLLFPDAPEKSWKEVLFLKETNAQIQVWEGWKYSKAEGKAASGIASIKYTDQFPTLLKAIVSHAEGVYLDINEHSRNALSTLSAAHNFAADFRRNFPAHKIERAAPLLESLRSVKEPEEIRQLQEATKITEKAFRRVLQFIRPGVYEYEIEAEIQHEFLRNRATGSAYESIIASGANACVLHYTQNNAKCEAGDLILMDFGAEYGNYSADLTRTVPVSGRYTERQKAVYNAVLRVMKAAKDMLRPGTLIVEYHKEVGKLMESELVGLGLLDKADIANQNPDWPAYKKYFMHGTSHFLGLDTHDVGNPYAPIKAGMVFTCEPGIYIPEENIGIRIENDIVVTDSAPMDLMENTPIEVEEIEEVMQRARIS